MPPYRQMFYQLCDLNVDEYVLRVGTAALGTEAFPAPLLLGISLRGKPCRGSRSWGASVSLVAHRSSFWDPPGLHPWAESWGPPPPSRT